MSSLQGHGRMVGWRRVNIQLDDDGINLQEARVHTLRLPKVCVCLCVCACSRSASTASRPPPPPRRLHLSLGSRGQYVPLSQVILQRVEDAELLFRLKHQQLLQQLARVGAPARQRFNIRAPPTTPFRNDPQPPLTG